MSDIPQWAWGRYQAETVSFWGADTAEGHPVAIAFARYIASKEEPPVDHLAEAMLAARKTRGLIGQSEAGPLAHEFAKELAKRGFEIVAKSNV